MLAEETLKIILAVIALGVLAYLLISVYNAGEPDPQTEFARATLERMIVELNAESSELSVYNPEGWWIASWPYEGLMPDDCSRWDNCVCIFPKEVTTLTPQQYARDSSKGVCREVSKRIIVSSIEGEQSPIKIENVPLKLNVEYGDQIILSN